MPFQPHCSISQPAGTLTSVSETEIANGDGPLYSQFAEAVCRVTKDFKDKKGFFTELEARVRYGVPAHLLDLCNIPNIGKVRAKKLYDFGIKSKDDFKKTDIDTLVKVINLKKSIVEDVLKSLD